jgi:predicted  nucleic acid-binding Zn-ribbon protein
MTDDALLAAIRELKEEVRESRKESQDMRDRMARMEGKLDVMGSIKETADFAKDTANEALQYAKSAHHRIDDIKSEQNKELSGIRSSLEGDIKKIEEHNTWLSRAVLTALVIACSSLIGFIVTNFILKK